MLQGASLCGLVLLLMMSLCGDAVLAQDDCWGEIAGYQYSLYDLVAAVGFRALVVEHQAGYNYKHVYQYKLCGMTPHLPEWPGLWPSDVAIFQRAVSINYKCGSRSAVVWSQRPNVGPDTGFVLIFSNGDSGRRSFVTFICDPSAGVGEWVFVEESPVRTYHFKWATQYACPLPSPSPTPSVSPSTSQSPTSSPSASSSPTASPLPSPTPSPVRSKCCLYSSASTVCSIDCPITVSGHQLTSQWIVDSCASCYFVQNPSTSATSSTGAWILVSVLGVIVLVMISVIVLVLVRRRELGAEFFTSAYPPSDSGNEKIYLLHAKVDQGKA